MQKHAVQNHTAMMMEIGTNLLNQTAEQTKKLTDVEAQVNPHYHACVLQWYQGCVKAGDHVSLL